MSIYIKMKKYQEKAFQYASNLQQRRRQQTRAQLRIWNQLPSIIFQIPAMIQQSDWTQLDNTLDSITDADIELVDESIKIYLWNKFQYAQKELVDQKGWKCQLYMNILRFILRLRIATDSHIKQFMMMLQEVHEEMFKNNTSNILEIMLKQLKDLAIYLEGDDRGNQILIGEDNQTLFIHIMSTMKIYMSWFDNKMPEFLTLFEQYRIFYISLVAHPLTDITAYINNRNVGQLYCVIDNALYNRDTQDVIKSIDIIIKMIRISNSSSKENTFALNGLQILLIDGIQRAKIFTSSFENINIQTVKFQFIGDFFTELLKVVSHCSSGTLTKSIKLLAQLFQCSDSYIQAVMKVNLHYQKIQVENNSKSKVQPIKKIIFYDYAEFFQFNMTSILLEVRFNNYWLISNVLGSDRFFITYGLQFLQIVYENYMLWEERESEKVQKQIKICILNFVCNLHLSPSIIEVLLDIKKKNSSEIVDFKDEGEYPENIFFFLNQAVLSQFDHLYNTSELGQSIIKGDNHNFNQLFHRSLYSLHTLLEITRNQKYSQIYEKIINQTHKRRIPIFLDNFSVNARSNQKQWENVLCLLEEVLKLLQGQRNAI